MCEARMLHTTIGFVATVLFYGCCADESDCSLCVQPPCTPTVIGVPDATFDPRNDVKTVISAMVYPYYMKRKIIPVLATRSELQRKEIAKVYYQKTNCYLVEDIDMHAHFSFRKILKALATPLPLFYVKPLWRAIMEKDIHTIVEIFTTLPPCVIRNIAKHYEERYGKGSLVRDIDSSLTEFYSRADFIDVLLSMAKGERDNNITKNKKEAQKDAKQMKIAFQQDQYSLKKTVFREVFTKRSIPQLEEIINSYENLRKKEEGSLEVDIQNGVESVKEIYITVVKIVKNMPMYFANELESILSKDEKSSEDKRRLIYIVRGRCDIDLEDIKNAFQKKFKVSVYEKLLLSLKILTPFYRTLLTVIKA